MSIKNSKFNRRGVSSIIVVNLFVVMMIFAFMTLNISNNQRHFTAAQISSDLASRWGVDALSRSNDTATISSEIRDLVDRNWSVSLAMSPKAIRESNKVNLDVNIQIGSASLKNGEFQFIDNASPANAVRVTAAGKVDSVGFMPVFGGQQSIARTATAMALERDLCLVIDRSGSMNFDLNTGNWMYDYGQHPYNKMSTSKNKKHRKNSWQWWHYWPHPTRSRWSTMIPAVYGLAEELMTTNQNELFSIVSYSSAVNYKFYDHSLNIRNYQPPTAGIEVQPTSNYQTAAQTLDNKYKYDHIVAGATNISAGIDQATQVLTGPSSRPHAFKTMIVMTDGQYNQGRSPWLAAEDAAALGIEVYTVTFSKQADQNSMIKTAENGNGRHFHAPDGDALEDIFREIANIPPSAYIE